ncbi:hypothetical protein NPIL_513391, partial [Nephila pilipes]
MDARSFVQQKDTTSDTTNSMQWKNEFAKRGGGKGQINFDAWVLGRRNRL